MGVNANQRLMERALRRVAGVDERCRVVVEVGREDKRDWRVGMLVDVGCYYAVADVAPDASRDGIGNWT